MLWDTRLDMDIGFTLASFECASFEFASSAKVPAQNNNPERYCFIAAELQGCCNQLLSDASGKLQLFTFTELDNPLNIEISSQHYLGLLEGRELWVIVVRGTQPIEGYQWLGLRSQTALITKEWFLLAGRALQVAQWFYDHRFCGRCGAATVTGIVAGTSDRALVCKPCNLHFYPRISPCMIVLVTRGDDILLAHHARAARLEYSTLAGFIEVGEGVEDAVRREVMEEVGVSLGRLDYFVSQPWPFPGQLMLGFFAEYNAGEICIDGEEILDAQWFRYDQLPPIPPSPSVAWQLIDHYVQQRYTLNNKAAK